MESLTCGGGTSVSYYECCLPRASTNRSGQKANCSIAFHLGNYAASDWINQASHCASVAWLDGLGVPVSQYLEELQCSRMACP